VVFKSKNFNLKFELDPDVLRKSISWSASLKYDHAKRRLGEGKLYKCKKLIWLSLRYWVYALQLLEKGRIYDYTQANKWWEGEDPFFFLRV